ncbi:MAG: hypothetical protein ACOX6V_05690, partial [Patescibacteria group bacterium]
MTYITKKLEEYDKKFKHSQFIRHGEIKTFLKQALEEQEREIKQNIGFLRQWLNERIEAAVILHNEPSTQRKLITNEDIEMWLFDFCPDKKPKNLLEAK